MDKIICPACGNEDVQLVVGRTIDHARVDAICLECGRIGTAQAATYEYARARALELFLRTDGERRAAELERRCRE